MSEFEVIGGNDGLEEGLDPDTAAFLEREQAEMNDLVGDVDTSAVPAATSEPSFGEGLVNGSVDNSVFGQPGDFGDVNNMNNISGVVTDNNEAFDSMNGLESTDPYAALQTSDLTYATSPVVQEWKVRQESLLADKDAREQAAHDAVLAEAKENLEKFHAQHSEQTTKAKALNRDAEASFINERDATTGNNSWERICKVVDLKNSRNSKDISRIRGIFLQLKQTPLVR